MKSAKLCISIALLATFMVISNANASFLSWSLDGVTFDDGGTATGGFMFDADALMYSSISITTSGGSTGVSNTYEYLSNYPSTYTSAQYSQALVASVLDDIASLPGTTTNGTGLLYLIFSSPLTNAGGTVPISAYSPSTPSLEAYCNAFPTDFGCITFAPFREIRTGAVIASTIGPPAVVPEPSTFLLLGGGLAGLAFVARRRKKE